MHSYNRSSLACISIMLLLFFTALVTRAGAVSFMSHRGHIKIGLGKAVEMRVPEDVTRVEIGTSKIADVMVLNPRTIRLVGNNPGSTNLVVWYGEDKAEEYEVLVNQGYRVEVLIGTLTYKNGSLVGW